APARRRAWSPPRCAGPASARPEMAAGDRSSSPSIALLPSPRAVVVYAGDAMRRRLLLSLAALPACGGNVNIAGISFAPRMACVVGGAAVAYPVTRLLERHLFDYDPRYFAWAFLPLTAIVSFGFWLAFVRA